MDSCVTTRRFVVDLFAGCGGLSLGLEQAGFEPVLVNELNRDALETYLVNRDDRFPLLRAKNSSRDVHELTADQCEPLRRVAERFVDDYGLNYRAGDLDLVVGGPPCQGYSGIGHRRSFPVDKKQLPSNHLYKEMVSIIRFLQPKMFLFENVRGILSGKWRPNGKKGEIWDDIMSAFKNIPGYRVQYRLVRASEFGVPQNRPRVLLAGIRSDIDRRLGQEAVDLIPKPDIAPPDLVDLLSDLEDPHYENGGETLKYVTPPVSEIQQVLRASKYEGHGSQEETGLTEHAYSNHSDAVVARFRWLQGGGDPTDPRYRTRKFAQRVIPRVWDYRGPTITATSLPDDYVHYSQPRTLTVREWARLQTFPDWYEFKGQRTTGGQRRAGNPVTGQFDREVPKYTQIGNAVPVAMAFELGKHFSGLLNLAER